MSKATAAAVDDIVVVILDMVSIEKDKYCSDISTTNRPTTANNIIVVVIIVSQTHLQKGWTAHITQSISRFSRH